MVNIAYNSLRVVDRLEGAQERVFSHLVLAYNGIIYPLFLGLAFCLIRPIFQSVRSLDRLDSLQVGSLEVRNVPALIKAPKLTGNGLPKNERDGFSPLSLGLSMSIDYQKRELLVAEQLPERESHTVLFLRQHRLAVVRGTVNGDRQVNFIVDTGGEVISISKNTAMALGPSNFRKIPLKVFGTSGWDTEAFLLPGVDLRFSDIEYNNFSVVVLNLEAPSTLLGFQVGGIVGHKFLSKYHVEIDLLRSEVRLSS